MSFFIENFMFALRGLQRHRLRSFLTMLGVIFGVGAVIAMLSIGKGAELEAIEQIKAFGINSIRIHALELDQEKKEQTERSTSKGLSYEDAKFIKKVLPYIEAVAPQNLIEKKVYFQRQAPEANIVGTTSDYLKVTTLNIAQGRFLSSSDIQLYRKVCVLGYDLVRELFLKGEVIGQFITIGGVRFRVIGFLSDKGKTKNKVQIKTRNVNRDIYIPITTSLKKFTFSPGEINAKNQVDYGVVDEIALRIDSEDKLTSAKDALTKILDQRHDQIKDYEIIVPTELLEQSQKTQRLFNLVMGCIAGLSLLVGGIGIMNIMLASVTERTREIGIRRAIGATPQDILLFFLLESLVISIFGGIIGIVVGVGISKIVTAYAGWKTIVSLESIILSFGVSSLVGIFFGLYPAYRASNMDPIQALRHT